MVGSSWWKAYHKLLPDFKRLSSCKASSGEIIKLWFDPWVNRPLAQLFPELFSFKKSEKIALADMVQFEDFLDHFHTPLSAQAFEYLNGNKKNLFHLSL